MGGKQALTSSTRPARPRRRGRHADPRLADVRRGGAAGRRRPGVRHPQEKDGFHVTARAMARAITPKTKAVVVNSPSNPTGAVVDPDDLLVIGDMAKQRGFTLLYDDTYARLVFRPGGTTRAPGAEGRGGRAPRGAGHGVEELLHDRLAGRLGDGAPGARGGLHGARLPHHAGAGDVLAGRGGRGAHRRRRTGCARWPRSTSAAATSSTPCSPRSRASPAPSPRAGSTCSRTCRGACRGRCPTRSPSARRLLEEKGVAVVPGEGFDAPGFVRLSFAPPPQISRTEGVASPSSSGSTAPGGGRDLRRLRSRHPRPPLSADAAGEGLRRARLAAAGGDHGARPRPRGLRRLAATGGSGRRGSAS